MHKLMFRLSDGSFVQRVIRTSESEAMKVAGAIASRLRTPVTVKRITLDTLRRV